MYLAIDDYPDFHLEKKILKSPVKPYIFLRSARKTSSFVN